ncbi:hypothetical protein [Variovorax sp. KK3]|uniref:hypothetical protein n=1 Tax=Variovorax sp. KK3 TaxID=1855728 RepID=UPI00097CBC35|nr:hypothetical protein [Variovorax sp. KK3]
MAIYPRTVSAYAKLHRARRHYEELIKAVETYMRSEPYQVGFEHRQGKGPTYFVSAVHSVPADIPVMIGDIFHNHRGSLDHLAYQLVWVATGKEPVGMKQLYFPVCDSKEQYLKRQSSGDQFFHSISSNMRKAIDDIAPYKGGNDALWKLGILNNIDKHKTLVASAGMGVSINPGWGTLLGPPPDDPSIPEDVRKSLLDARKMLDDANVFLRLAEPIFPMKAGDAFLHGVGQNAPVKIQSYFALGVPGLIPPRPIGEAITEIATAVEDVATRLESFFVEP